MAAIEYGTVAIIPDGAWEPNKQYEVGILVSHDGSSYVANKKPPVGTLPTDANYWQISAQGTSKATSEIPGVMKPDNVTTEVNQDASITVKTAKQSALGIVKGSTGINVGGDGSIDVNTQFEQATQLANIIAGEAIASIWGKVSKSVAATMNLDQNALLKNMLTSINVNDANKVPTAALTYAMQQLITKNTNDITALNGELPVGPALTTTFPSGVERTIYSVPVSKGVYLISAKLYSFAGVTDSLFRDGTGTLRIQTVRSIYDMLVGVVTFSTASNIQIIGYQSSSVSYERTSEHDVIKIIKLK